MIYTGLNRTGEIETVKAHGGYGVAEVYGGINEANPIYYKAITITGTSPLTFKGLGLPLKDYCIYGNTVQDGTSTPDNPVDVVGCGARTANLFDGFDYYGVVPSINNGNNADYLAGASTDYIEVDNPLITLSKDESFGNARIYIFLYDDNKTFIGYAVSNTTEITSRTISNYTSAKFARIRVDSYHQYAEQYMLNTGSTALPHEPYGYKLPITVNGTKYPIYLGQVPTTRRINKLVLTGDEGWRVQKNLWHNDTALFALQQSKAQIGEMTNRPSVNTHFISVEAGVNPQGQDYVCSGYHPVDVFSNFYYIRLDFATIGITLETTEADAITAFKSYLAAQYAAGTPVTVWYVLAEPETAVVNEPLHKIGDYADTISMAQAGVTIPTVAGANTMTIDTTVKPSEVSITGNIKEVQGT